MQFNLIRLEFCFVDGLLRGHQGKSEFCIILKLLHCVVCDVISLSEGQI